ncbi:hypothetical protein EC973_006305 [Apophysomyces ossiformis]|uniref:Uncharacterized protein n=1 Tax=Apophysomyces ossiformis TaxID=679940 RepID=A0A8H7EL02_9FUNG|nr:hypothetical protein EC973_006305 [Apophysomyces ossiformis]
MDHLEICKQLQKLKIDTSRLLDIVFPARSVVGLLFHIQYIPEVTQLLEAAKVAALKDFDPLDPSILADPSLQSLSETERADQAAVIHRQRCLRSLQHIRSTVAPAVARHFIEQGWIDQLDADHVSRSSVGTLFTSSNKDMMTDSDLPNSLAFGTQSQHQ